MAELVLYVSADTTIPSTRFQDGDVIQAFTQRRVWATHAQHYCHRKLAGFNADGLRPAGSLAETWYALTHEFKFVRVGSSVERHHLWEPGVVDVLGATPNAAGEHIVVEDYVRLRKLHPRHKLFGAAGAEVWYGGRMTESASVVDAVWTAIETQTAYRKADHPWWPLSLQERMHFLALPVTDITDETADTWNSIEYDETGPTRVLLRKRKHFGPWRDVVTTQALRNRVLDMSREVDLRGTIAAVNGNLLIRAKS